MNRTHCTVGLLCVLVAAACREDAPEVVAAVAGSAGGVSLAGGNRAMPLNAVKFSDVYQQVIVGSGCNGGVCHSSSVAGGLSMRSKDLAYRSLVGVPAGGTSPGVAGVRCADTGLARVVPGKPDASLLVQKLEPTQTCGAPMPPTEQPLPPLQLQLVRNWIAGGALDD